jgi:hypothetical protein
MAPPITSGATKPMKSRSAVAPMSGFAMAEA